MRYPIAVILFERLVLLSSIYKLIIRGFNLSASLRKTFDVSTALHCTGFRLAFLVTGAEMISTFISTAFATIHHIKIRHDSTGAAANSNLQFGMRHVATQTCYDQSYTLCSYVAFRFDSLSNFSHPILFNQQRMI